MKQTLYKITAVICTIFLATSCSEDDATGYSTMVPTSPTLSVDWGFENTQTLVEEEKTYPFTVTLSEPQIVDVQVDLQQVGGDATEGDDFAFPHTITIPAGETSATGELVIHADELAEEAESVVIMIGSGFESNVSAINSETITFNIQNLTAGELMATLSWDASTTVTNNFGEEIAPTTLVDLRLLVTDVPYTEIIEAEDGAGFETFTFDETLPDGEYYLVTDFFSAMDIATTLDLALSFDQVGVINDQTYNFPNALDLTQSCPGVYFILAKVVKSGTDYTIEPVGETNPVLASTFVGEAEVVVDDWADYEIGQSITIEPGDNENEFFIRQYDNPYISNPDTAYLIATVDPDTGAVTVESNEPFDYGQGDEGGVFGSGTVNQCTGEIDLNLTYDLGALGVYEDFGFDLVVE